MDIDYFSAALFMLIASITPGPNNISSFSMSANQGYRKTLPYMLGIWLGTLILMSIAGFFSSILFTKLPVLKDVLKYLGAAYIIYLAYKTFTANYDKENTRKSTLGFWNGVILQAVNPKALVFSTTLYSTLLAPLSDYPLWIIPSALCITIFTFLGISSWALFGGFIKRFMHKPEIRLGVNGLLSLALVYLAIRIAIA